MPSYDPVAGDYDAHFRRRVDAWEDARLATLLRPHIDGRTVLDLGAGTGWILDHLHPAAYVGVDASGPMLAELGRKHPAAETVKARVGAPGWLDLLPAGDHGGYQTITATWALEYLGPVVPLLMSLGQAWPRATLALHGTLPRGHRRPHFIDKAVPWRDLTCQLPPPWVMAREGHACYGTGALPDSLAFLGRRVWEFAAAWTPPLRQYACLWVMSP